VPRVTQWRHFNATVWMFSQLAVKVFVFV